MRATSKDDAVFRRVGMSVEQTTVEEWEYFGED
jgi:hypothetical protein